MKQTLRRRGLSNLQTLTGALMRAILVLPLALSLLLPAGAEAQRRRRDRDDDHVRVRVYRDRYREPMSTRDLSLMVGVLKYDYAEDNLPTAALRAGWRLNRFLRSELDVSYATGDVGAVPGSGDAGGERNASLGAATVGIQAELPFPFLRPYAGAAAGLFGRWDEGDGGSFVRPTHAFPVGVRLALSPRIAVRAETRFRFDEHESGPSATNTEYMAGLSFGF